VSGPADAPAGPQAVRAAATRRRSLRTAATITAAVGAAHALLFLLSFWLLSDVPGANASNAEIEEFYASESSRRPVLVGLYVMPFAAIAFVWFIVALRTWIEGSTRRINVLLSNIQLVSGIVYVALFCSAAGATSVLAASVEFAEGDIDPVAAHSFPEYGDSLLFPVWLLALSVLLLLKARQIPPELTLRGHRAPLIARQAPVERMPPAGP
jgi:hypothetical protein